MRPAAAAPPSISLLHATYRRANGPQEVRDAWLERAAEPTSIEYVVAMDADDELAVGSTDGWPRVVSPAGDGEVTAVRNWNAAAGASHGDLLFVVADDLVPPPAWDDRLREVVRGLDPRRAAFAVKVSDAPDRDDVKLRHPVVSRAFYRRLGLFSPAYTGLYADDDLTARAFWRSIILDGRTIELDHQHPDTDPSVEVSASQARMNRSSEYDQGRSAYVDGWPRRHRAVGRRLYPIDPGRPLSHRRLIVGQRLLRARSYAAYLRSRARGPARRPS